MSQKKKVSRRHFLRTATGCTVGAVGLPYFVPSSAMGKAGYVAPSERITMGCIGLGGQGTRNMEQFIQQSDVQVVALCDVNKGSQGYLYAANGWGGLEPARKRALNMYEEQNQSLSTDSIGVYSDFQDLLAQKDIDAVTVCTPDHWHGLISKAAVEAGKDVYCEKPLVNTIAEGRALLKAISRGGKIVQTGSHERSNDSVRFACELVRNGRIGKLQAMYVNMPNRDPHHLWLLENTGTRPTMPVPEGFDYDMWLGPAPWEPYTKDRCHFWWRFILQYGGGEITDRGAHIIDLAQLANNSDDSGPIEIVSKGKALKGGLFNSFIEYDFECTYDNGVRLIGGSEGERGIKLVGTEGWIFIHIHGGRLDAEPKSLLNEKIRPNEIHLDRSPGHHRNFLDSVKSRKLPIAHAGIGHRTATICHLLNIAMLTGKKLVWDPKHEKITNDEEANRMTRRPMRSPWRL